MKILKEDQKLEKKTSDGREVVNVEGATRNLFTYSAPHSFVAEQFRIMRFGLLRQIKRKGMRSILVTSTMPQEGKTFVASNLAVSIAPEIEKETVLVDFDLRKPSIHEVFGLGRQAKGLSSFFEEGLPLTDVMLKTNIPNLSIIPSGPVSDRDSVYITTRKMTALRDAINSINQEYFFIIDAGPACIIADPLVISDVADGIILVVKAGHTKKSVVENSVKLIGKEKIAGVVLNYSESNPDVYRDYHRYYSKY